MLRLLILFFLVSTQYLQASPIFVPNDLPLAQTKATNEGKLLVVEFGATWCAPCQIMEKSTWPSQNVVDFCENNCVVVFLDVDDAEGNQYSNQYRVKSLPTILVFNTKGELVGRMENSMSSSRLVDFLTQFNIPENKSGISQNIATTSYNNDYTNNAMEMAGNDTYDGLFSKPTSVAVPIYQSNPVEKVNMLPTSNQTYQDYTTQNQGRSNRMDLSYEVQEVKPQQIASEPLKMSQPVVHQSSLTYSSGSSYGSNLDHRVEEPSNYSKVKPEVPVQYANSSSFSAQAQAYTIQVGAFKDLNNALRIQRNMIETYQQTTTVEMPKSAADGLYRVVVGVFSNENEAEQLKSRMAHGANHSMFIRTR